MLYVPCLFWRTLNELNALNSLYQIKQILFKRLNFTTWPVTTMEVWLAWKQDFFSFFIFCLKWGGNAILMLRNYSFGHYCSSSDFCRILQIIYNCKILYLAPLKNYSNTIIFFSSLYDKSSPRLLATNPH